MISYILFGLLFIFLVHAGWLVTNSIRVGKKDKTRKGPVIWLILSKYWTFAVLFIALLNILLVICQKYLAWVHKLLETVANTHADLINNVNLYLYNKYHGTNATIEHGVDENGAPYVRFKGYD